MKKFYHLILIALLLSSCATPSYISVDSTPKNAEVFVISKWKFDQTGLDVKDYQKIKQYQINEGNTPVVTKQRTQKYKVVVKKDDSIEIREVDLNPSDTTSIKIDF